MSNMAATRKIIVESPSKMILQGYTTSLKDRFSFHESTAVNRLKNARHFKYVVLTANLAVLLSQAV